jgi:hypothetical protein
VKRRSLVREVLSSTAGKLGVALALTLGLVSLLVLVTFPLDFGPTRWSNPSVWADYPRAVPPAWTAALSSDAFEHRVITAEEATESTERGAAPVPSRRTLTCSGSGGCSASLSSLIVTVCSSRCPGCARNG